MKLPKIDWPRTIAGALAAVAAAILLSKLGAAGTLIGAAVGSLVISIGTNVGAHGIQSTTERMLEAQKEAARRVSEAQAEVHKARQQVADSTGESADRLAAAEGALESAQSQLAKDVPTSDIPVIDAPILDESDHPGVALADVTQVLPVAQDPTPRFPWKRVAVFTVASFVIALLAITAFELIGGKPLSSYFGGPDSHGTTVGDSIPGGSGSTSKPPPKPVT
ncbi:MAG TPA: hypothetical protein VN108_03360, partial [Marmoricola sp.]|nr:hypothetical protein [Marmoricola sp.]